MTGAELDQKMRQIILAVTRETVLSSTAALVELGFAPAASFRMLQGALAAKEAIPSASSPSKPSSAR